MLSEEKERGCQEWSWGSPSPLQLHQDPSASSTQVPATRSTLAGSSWLHPLHLATLGRGTHTLKAIPPPLTQWLGNTGTKPGPSCMIPKDHPDSSLPLGWVEASVAIALQFHFSFCPILPPSLPHKCCSRDHCPPRSFACKSQSLFP